MRRIGRFSRFGMAALFSCVMLSGSMTSSISHSETVQYPGGTLSTTPGRTPNPDGKIYSREPMKGTALSNKQREMPSITPTDYTKAMSAKKPTVSTYKPSSIKANVASNTVQGPASIAELARSLKNDPDLIYQYVANNVDYYPVWGEQKGALGALIDGSGTDTDQAELLLALLTQAGFTANLEYGQITLTGAQIANLLHVDISSYVVADYLLSQGGIPHTYTYNPSTFALTSVTMNHVWVNVTISGTTYAWDPSFKTYNYTTGLTNAQLASAMSYVQNTFVTNSESGATINTNYVQNINPASSLTTLSNNLVAYIKANNPTATVDNILGGKSLLPTYTPVRQTSLPYLAASTTPTAWTSGVPAAFTTTVRVEFQGIDQTLTSAQMYGHRLTMMINASNQPQLTLDGTVLQTGTNSGFSSNYITLVITHNAYASTNQNETTYPTIMLNQGSAITAAFGTSSRGMIEYHRNLLQANLISAGNNANVDSTMGESAEVLFSTFTAETSRAVDLLDRINGTNTIFHHRIAVIQESPSPYMSLQGDYASFPPLNYSSGNSGLYQSKTYVGFNLLDQAFEGLAISQVGGIDSITTPAAIAIASAAGDKIYDATSTNWSGTVLPGLTGYSTATTNSFYSSFINTGNTMAIPSNGSLIKDNWTGFGVLVLYSNGSFFPDFLGTLQGGSGTQFIAQPAFNTQAGSNQPEINTEGYQTTPQAKTQEPIDLYTGNFLYDHTDLTVGSQSFPYALSFSRSYNSGRRNVSSTLGRGWTYNANVSANVGTDGFQGLGEDSAIDAASAIAALYTIQDFVGTTTQPYETFDKTVITMLSVNWLTQQLYKNSVTLTFQDDNQVFIKLADGSYNPAPKHSEKLSLSAGAYTYTRINQEKLVFNTLGNIASFTQPSGVTVTYTYNASNQLSTISNGIGRTLTLNYTSNQLTSVTDGTGRSVVFTYDGNNNLVQVQDANGQLTKYAYVIPGQMTQLFLPNSATAAFTTNTYDSLNRVKTQTNALGQVWNYFFANSRAEEDDPQGNKHVLYYNSLASVTRDIDALSNETDNTYDGLNRLTKAQAPEGNSDNFTYDANNNILSKTSIAKPGSGLSNLVQTFTYDPTWGKVHTAQDARLNTTTYTYDPTLGNLLTIQRPMIGSQTPTVTYTYNTRGQVLTVTDETGVVTKFVYDSSTEKLLSETVDYSVSTGHLNLTTNLGYDSVGNVTSAQDPRGNTTSTIYDNLRQLTQLTYPAPFNYVSKTSYDYNGNKLTTQSQTGDVNHPWQTYTMTYSASNQKKTLTDSAGLVTTWNYDTSDRLMNVIDPVSREYQYTYDADNRVYQVTDPTNVVTETRMYTNNGLRKSTKDARGNTTQNSYDGFDRPSTTTYADSSYEQNVSYDANGNPLTVRSRSGNTIVNTYDALNRLNTRAPSGEPTITYGYDLRGRLISASTPVVSGDPSSGNFQKFYDTAGRFYKEEYSDGKLVTYALDANGNVTTLTYADGYYVTRVYDQLNRLTDVKLNGSTSSAANFQYDQLSRRTSLTFNNGASVNYGYKSSIVDDLTSITHSFVGSSVAFTYGFDNGHDINSQSTSDSTYLWHPAAAATTSYGTATSVNQYPTVAGTTYTYNSNADLISDGTWTYTYNTENQLTAASKSGVSVSYLYDPLSRQAQKTVGAVKSRYIYSGFQRIADYDGSAGTLQNRYIYGATLDEPIIQVSNAGVVTYYHANAQHSIIGVTSSSGVLSNKNSYGPFGEGVAVSGTTFGYTGQRFDSDTGLYYYKNRYYSPSIGRFLQPDHIQAPNLYSYASNSPLSNTDPYGLDAVNIAPNLGVIYKNLKLALLCSEQSGLEYGGSIDRSDSPYPFANYYHPGTPLNENQVNIRPLPYTSDVVMAHQFFVNSSPGFIKSDYELSITRNVRIWSINASGNVFEYDPTIKDPNLRLTEYLKGDLTKPMQLNAFYLLSDPNDDLRNQAGFAKLLKSLLPQPPSIGYDPGAGLGGGGYAIIGNPDDGL